MTRIRLALMATLALCASALAAQQAPGPGDLAPRAGTIAYMISDKPDALYRLFARDNKGGWKLRSFAESMLHKQHEAEPDSEQAQRDQQVFEYVFGSYEAVQRVEIALVDVTLDGPKYLVWLYTRKGETINPQPEFLKDFLAETKDYKGIKYHLYRVPEDEPPADEDGERPRNVLGDNLYGMDRYYVASTPNGLMLANFESTIRDAIDRLSSGDYSESLSGREEFAEWTKSRKPHDLSVFVIGREIQNAIERVLPSEDQVGVDAEGIYKEIDKWLQFREYKYVVFDLDYEDAARGVTVAASFKTRRQTRLLEKLAIEPSEFKLLKYVPEGAMLTAGLQLGDAKTTFNNLKELGYDVEKWADEIQQGLRGGSRPPEEMPPEENGMEPRSMKPLDLLKSLQDMAEEEGEEGDERESQIDRALSELEEMLVEYGTSTDELLGVLGSEVVLFVSPNTERARAHGRSGMDALFASGDFGIAIGLKDVAKAKAILANAREKDSQGAFRGFTRVDYQGKAFEVSSEQPFGYAFTDDALLIVVALGVVEEDATQPVIARLKAMSDAATRTRSSSAAFVKEGSKFVEFDFGAASRITNQLSEDLSRRLDRYAQPPLDKSPTSFTTDLTMALRLKEYKDGVELAIRVAGLPDFGQFLDGDASLFGGASATRNAYNYSEDNLRALSSALHSRADNDKPVDLEAMLKAGEIRAGALQVPFDARWKGDLDKLGWTTLDQVARDSQGNLPEWVNKDAAAMIEANEKEGFRSIVLAKGDIRAWLSDYKTGFIVAYQEQPDTLGGHVVLYADTQIGWLSAEALKQALELNEKGEPVPAAESWRDGGSPKPKGVGPRMKEDDPWFPGPREDEK